MFDSSPLVKSVPLHFANSLVDPKKMAIAIYKEQMKAGSKQCCGRNPGLRRPSVPQINCYQSNGPVRRQANPEMDQGRPLYSCHQTPEGSLMENDAHFIEFNLEC